MSELPNTFSRALTSAACTVIKANDETNDAFAIVAVKLPPHSAGAPLHHHMRHAEGLYVIDGMLALTHDQYTFTLSSGASALIRPGVLHSYWNPTAMPTTILLIYRSGVSEAEAIVLATGSSDIHDAE